VSYTCPVTGIKKKGMMMVIAEELPHPALPAEMTKAV
jgi:hypothetical protein